MPEIDSSALYQRWLHSHEEDSGDQIVFRPITYNFPPSRGRRGFELKPDGTLVQIGIGPTDRPAESSGTWELHDDQLVFHTGSGSPEVQTHRVVNISSEKLVLTIINT